MTSIIAFIRTDKKEKDIKTKVKFQIRGKDISLNYKSEIKICPDNWDQNDITYKRKQTYAVVRYSVEKYIYFKANKNRQFYYNSSDCILSFGYDLNGDYRVRNEVINSCEFFTKGIT